MIVVQVANDPLSTKGARLTTHLTLPSRNLVYLPRNKHIGIYQRLEDEDERERLQNLIVDCNEKEGLEDKGGYILRTASEGVSEAELMEDIRFLKRLWTAVERRINSGDELRVLYKDVPLYMRSMRDLITPMIEKIRVDNMKSFNDINQFISDFIP